VPALEDGLVLLERGFAQGEVPLFAVTSARARFVEAQRAALVAHADYDHALAELEFAVGAPLDQRDTRATMRADPDAASPGGAP